MTAVAPAVLSARDLRQSLRTARRAAHPAKRFVGLVTDVLPYVVIVGGLVVQSVRRLAELSGAQVGQTHAAGGAWLLVAGLVLLLAGALRVLGALGPVSAGRPMLTWVLSTPVDRRGLLSTRFSAGALGSAVPGAALFTAVALTDHLPVALVAWSAVLGALVGVAMYAAMVLLEAGGQAERVSRRGSAALAGVAVLLALIPVSAPLTGWRPDVPPAEPLLYVGVPLVAVVAAAVLVSAHRALGRLSRGVLGAGGDLTMVTVTSVAWMDLSLLTGTLEFRRLRRIATVRSRRGGGRGVSVLLWSELRRLVRMPGAVAGWVALALVPYAAKVVVSSTWVLPLQLVAGALAVSRLTAGLRAINGRTGLRRMLPFGDRALRLLHCVVPVVAALVWAGATVPAVVVALDADRATAAFLLLAVAATAGAGAMRSAIRPPLVYDVPTVSSPFGDLPIGLIQQVLRGPDLVVGLALLALAGLPPVALAVVAVAALLGTVLTRSK
ncbi:DUF6297 family protein [Streptoalloteichus hindustanus]|uniref:ABC-2 type transport system permease protein n=1 Tax=Streptoalloteichus hindustanus TaxID=2017 RepID=A0A1M5PC10_STRHI|nr:DUF6297 family protein [Streptoalloteichus hindustanus]SHG99255.1 hypothetical protein SAMN05444320_1182 [Streptoalloteichus hindustanus]